MESSIFVGIIKDAFRVKDRGVVLIGAKAWAHDVRVNNWIRVETESGARHRARVLGIEHVNTIPKLENPLALLVSKLDGVDLSAFQNGRVYRVDGTPERDA
jgi:hypothetical protein